MNRTVLLVPVYNHASTVGSLIAQLARYELPLLLVNDGSDAACTDVLRELAGACDWVSLFERDSNGGKGAAVKSGLREAARRGFSHALQLDADGQHSTDDVARLLALSAQEPEALITGAPTFDNAPALRFYGRYLTHIWVWINTLSLDIRDAMCGFRVYPLASTLAVLDSATTGNRMDFDPEILVRLHWAGVKVCQFNTPVHYPEDGISHFRGFRDNVLISWAHTRLFFGMCYRLPRLLQAKRQRHDAQ